MSTKLFNLKVIIIDDDYLTTIIHRQKLIKSKIGIESVIFNDGRDAIEFIKNSDTFETLFILLLDLDMPYLNGLKLLEELESLKRLKFIVFIISSSIDCSIKNILKQNPQIEGFYNKPFSDKDCSHLKGKICFFQRLVGV
jgi:FixJ family two-component response regulator